MQKIPWKSHVFTILRKNQFLPIFYTQNGHFSIFVGALTLWRHTLRFVLILVSMERGCPYLYIGSKFRVIWPSVLIIQRGGCNNPPLGKYVWEKPSGEQGLKSRNSTRLSKLCTVLMFVHVSSSGLIRNTQRINKIYEQYSLEDIRFIFEEE